jgi:FixJ family two-component response regulator
VEIPQKLVTVVDDDHSISRMLGRVITAAGFDVLCFSSAEEFLESERAKDSACLILDYNLPGITGADLQRRLVEQGKEVPIVFISAEADDFTQKRVLKAGAVAFFSKPFRIDSLLAQVRTVAALSLA